ncbi:MAG: hypothetical protein KAI24_23980, partial [Planctomycetes bacterium]|nr:hypothetical protein [Planctomycetota bacterium]
EDGTVHFRPNGDYGRLQPVPSSEVPRGGPSPLERLCADASSAGLAVRAWTVFGHNTRFGLQHPELTVRNAHGDHYPYALCPAQSDVRAYHAQLVRDLAAHDGLATIELEALGQMGIQHSSHHDKKSFTPKGLLAFALSACFCDACLRLHAELGQDGEACREQVRAYVDGLTEQGCAMAPAAVPGDDSELEPAQRTWVEAVLAVRRRSVQQVADAAVAASGACARAVQVHPDRWFTGSQLSAECAAAFPPADQRVFTCYGEGPGQIAALLDQDGARATAGSPRRLCIWPKAPQFTEDEDLRQTRALCEQRAIDSIAIYHLGLLPWRTVERVAKMLQA